MKKNVIIAAGGTGGHIYPALAIAKSVELSHPETEVHFVGTPKGLEAELIPRENFPLHTISIGRLNRSAPLFERIQTLLLMPWAFVQSVLLVIKLKPVWVLGVGGFASGPVIFVAALLRVKSYIWEPNAYPGLANRLLSRFVAAGLLMFENSLKHLKVRRWFKVGYPLRSEFSKEMASSPDAENRQFRILIFGGSQGARAINEVVMDLFSKPSALTEGIEVVHQTGRLDYQKVKEVYEKSGVERIEAFEYLYDMPERYAWADIVICRSGAGTLAELAAMGKASILIPLPWAADDHQRKNAEVLVEQGAGHMLLQKDLTSASLQGLLLELSRDRPGIARMGEAVKKFYDSDGTSRIVRILCGEEGDGREVSSI